jgi:hypothetical protein
MSDVTAPSGLAQQQQADGYSQQQGQGPEQGQGQEQTQELTGQVQDKAREGAGKAQDKVREEVEHRAQQAGERVSGTATDLRSVGEELRKQGKDAPAQIADRAAEQAEKVGSYLGDTSPDQILHDVEDFGRKRPGALLVGGLVAGAVAARFLKASSRDRYRQRGAVVRS